MSTAADTSYNTGAGQASQQQGARRSSDVELQSLAPAYDEQQHLAYVTRLESALQNPKNLNIALTGPYGTGKSSVLDKFVVGRAGSTLRLAISTLGPDPDERSLTNRIQKELVKQLVYNASAGTLRKSRFRRVVSRSRWRSFVESALAVAVIGTLLALLGWLPTVKWADSSHGWLQSTLVWAVVFGLAVAVVTTVRQMTANQFFLSNVSAAGASVTVSEQAPTPFDEYLEVIVRYFDEESKDVVVLEDLDRFNDPHIFEALRELNTLLNSTPARVRKKSPCGSCTR